MKEKLLAHVGHAIECVTYGNPAVNVAIECTDCDVVIVDVDLLTSTDQGEPRYEFTNLGEGRHGEYNPSDPEDMELLRLDYIVDGEEVESACTNLPASATEVQRAKAIALVRWFVITHPEVPARKVTEIFSWLDESWLEPGGADDLLTALLTAITYPKETP